jgi:hypothetical protein
LLSHVFPMTRTLPPAERLQLLFDVLRCERYVRRALLEEVVEELEAMPAQAAAIRAARGLATEVKRGIADDRFRRAVDGIARLVH